MLRRILLLSAALFLLAGCAGVTAPKHWTPDPQGAQSTTLPLYRQNSDREDFYVEVEIAGLPTRELFGVATWRKRTTISLSLARRLGLKIRVSTDTLDYLGEDDRVFLVTLPTLKLGDLVLKDFTVRVQRDRFSPYYNPPMTSGLLGNDVLRYFKLTYDREQELLHLSSGEPLGLPPGEPAQVCSIPERYGHMIDLEDLGYDPGDDLGEGLWARFGLGHSGIALVKQKFEYEGKPAEFGPMYFSGLTRPGWYIRETGELFHAKEFEFLGQLKARDVFVELRFNETFWGGGVVGSDIWPDYVILVDLPADRLEFYKRPQTGERVKTRSRLDRFWKNVKEALDKHPDDAALHFMAGVAQSEKDNLGRAIEYLRKAVELAPNNGEYWEKLGDALYDDEQLDEALSVYEKAASVDPNRPAALTDLALRRFWRGERDKAREAAEQLIAQADKIEKALEDEEERAKKGETITHEFIDDKDRLDVPVSRKERALSLLARLHFEASEGEKAIKRCREAVELRGEHGGCRDLMALQYVKNDQLQAALDQWDFWLSYNHHQTYWVISQLRKVGKLRKLGDAMEYKLKRYPGKVGLYRGLAQIARIEGDREKIIHWAKTVSEANPDHPEMLGTAIDIYIMAGEFDKALALADRIEAFQPDRFANEMALARAQILFEAFRLDDASTWAAKAHELANSDDDRAAAKAELGRIKREQGEWDAAVKFFEERLKEKADPDGIRLGYGESLVRSGRKADAEPIVRPVIADMKEYLLYESERTGWRMARLAEAYRILEDNLDEAGRLATEAVAAEPERTGHLDVLARVELARGNKDAAKAAWTKAAELEPWSLRWKSRLKKAE